MTLERHRPVMAKETLDALRLPEGGSQWTQRWATEGMPWRCSRPWVKTEPW